MKRMLALLLGLLMMFTCAAAENGSAAAAETAPAVTENYMIPQDFLSLFNTSFSMSVDLIRSSVGDEEADSLVENYSLSLYAVEDQFYYYGSKDWLIEAGFAFDSEEAVAQDAPCVSWHLFISDKADEMAWYVGMYSLNLMIGYTFQDMSDEVLQWFQTVEIGSILELPDGNSLITSRTEDNDGVLFIMLPSSAVTPAAGTEQAE